MLIYEAVQATPVQFVGFWSCRYGYAEEELYDDNIEHELTEKRILDLYRWKNGGPLSARKKSSVQRNFIERRMELQQLSPGIQAGDFLARFLNGGAIWRIFWLHCWQPRRFPIYDQHVHRAMAFLQTGAPEEIPSYDPHKINSYIAKYLPFHATFNGFGDQPRIVDKALWAFGKFLNEANFPTDLS
jgi:hypothetical protein